MNDLIMLSTQAKSVHFHGKSVYTKLCTSSVRVRAYRHLLCTLCHAIVIVSRVVIMDRAIHKNADTIGSKNASFELGIALHLPVPCSILDRVAIFST